MKKSGITLLLVLVTLFAIACSSSQKLAGTYVLTSMDGKSPTQYMQELADEYGVDANSMLGVSGLSIEKMENYMQIVFYPDGALVWKTVGQSDRTMTWTKNGNTIIIKNPQNSDEPLKLTLNNNTLECSLEGIKYVFSKPE